MIKLKRIFLFSFILFIFFCAHSAFSQDNNKINISKKQEQSYIKLKNEISSLNVRWDKINSIPSWMNFKNIVINKQDSSNSDCVYQFLDENKDIYKINNPQNELKKVKENKDKLGYLHITLQQEYKNIPVFSARMKFHLNEAEDINSISSTYIPNIPEINIQPVIFKEQAIKIAQDKLKQNLRINDNKYNSLNIELQEPQLIIYNHGLFSKQKTESKLTWRLTLNSKKNLINWIFFIDAKTGDIIFDYNDMPSARNRETYVLADCFDTIGTLTYNESSTSQSNTYGSAAEDEQAWEIHALVGNAYDYFYNSFERRSYDDNGGIISSYAHYEEDDNSDGVCEEVYNASGADGQMSFGENFYAQDIVGHEFTHSVNDYTAQSVYYFESGAVDESYSDFFGELSEFEESGGDWLLGEDLPSGAGRNMADPAMSPYNDADNISNECTATNDYCSFSSDDGGVHTNSGILNKAAYLIIVGGTHYGVTVTGIGQEKAEQIYYRTLTEYLDTASDFDAAFEATLQSCLDFYERGEHSITLADCNEVYKAFHAVGIATDPYFYTQINTPVGTSGYAPLAVDFDASDSYSFGDTITNYVWNFGDGTTGTGTTISHTYIPGTYTYSLTITDSTGDTDTLSGTVIADNPITPTFTIIGDGIASPATVSFDASGTLDATGTIANYSWNFGDGSTNSSGASATTTHEYTNSGYYNAVLAATDSNGYTNTYTKSVFIGNIGPTYVSGIIYNDTWAVSRSPYVINGSLEVAGGGTLTIEPGVIIKFYDVDSYLTISGTLIAEGTSTDQIIFTSFKDDAYGGDTNNDGSATFSASGDWYQIIFNSASTGNIDNAIISYGGSTPSFLMDYPVSMIVITSDAVNIENSTISNANNDYAAGIYIQNAVPIISNNTFDYTYVPISIEGYTGSNIINIYNNTGLNNNNNAILIGGTVNGNFILPKDSNFPYLFSSLYIENGYTITIEAGSVIKFQGGGSGVLQIYGALNAEGTATEPIIFTSMYDDAYGSDLNSDSGAYSPAAGDWNGIRFYNGSSGNIRNTVISYGGNYSTGTIGIYSDNVSIADNNISNCEFHCLDINSTSPTIDGNIISGSDYNGINLNYSSPIINNNQILDTHSAIYSNGTSTAQINNNIIASNIYGIEIYSGSPVISDNDIYDNYYGLFIRSSATPVISNNNIYSNSSYGLYYSGSTAITAENNWWGSISGPYNAISNPAGIGNQVSSNVDYNPWLASSIFAPIANAGSDQIVTERADVILNGSISSDPSGTGLAYNWSQTSGASVALSDSAVVSPTFTAPSISVDETLTFELTVTNARSETNSDAVNILVQADITPPADAASLTAREDVWQRRINLSWVRPVDSDFVGVKIDRFDGTSTTTLTTGYTRASYTDSGLAYGTVYTYTVYSQDADGNQSTGVNTGKIIRNPAPSSLTLTAGNSQILADWARSSAPSRQIAGYRVYYRVRGIGSYNMIDAGNTMSYTISGLTNGAAYQVFATAYSVTGIESPRSFVRIAVPSL